jgi:hypothetical protein
MILITGWESADPHFSVNEHLFVVTENSATQTKRKTVYHFFERAGIAV